MRLPTAVILLTLFLGAPVCFATQVTMAWWNASGDAIVVDGVTISLTGTGIEPGVAMLEPCKDSCNPYIRGFASTDVREYLGTDTEVLLYGRIAFVGNYFGFMSHFTSASPYPCTVSVQEATWSQIKQLYRDPAASRR